MRLVRATPGRLMRLSWANGLKPRLASCCSRFSGGKLSESRKMTSSQFTPAMAKAMIAGPEKGCSASPATALPGSTSCQLKANPPIAGPRMKPKPSATPIRIIPEARFLPVVMSAATAEAVEIFPAMMPPSARPSTSRAKLPANTQIRFASTMPPSVKISVGRRPCLSEYAPQIGAKTNCKKPYSEPTTPPNRVATALVSPPAN